MTYTKAGKDATMRYTKKNQKRLEIRFKTSEYREIIEPAIIRSGLPSATFIKQAIYEKIERDGDGRKK